MEKIDKLFNKNFNILVTGQFVSALGSSIYSVVIILFLKEITGSGTVMGIVETVSLLPAVFLGPFSGTIVDYFDRKKIIVITDLISGVAMILLSLPGFYFIRSLGNVGAGIDFSSVKIEVWMIIVVTMIISVSYSLFRPAVDAAVPDLVPEKSLKKANSILQSSAYFTILIGSTLGGLFFSTLGAPLLIFFNGVSYIISAFEEMFLSVPALKNVEDDSGRGFGSYVEKTADGMKYLWRYKGLRTLILSFMFTNTLFPPIVLSLPFFIEDTLGLPPNYYGYMMATYMIGGIAGFAGYGVLKVGKKANYLVFVATFFIVSFLMLAVSFSSSAPVVFALFALASVNIAIINLIANTIIPKVVPSDKRGRVYGTMGAIGAALMPLSFGVSGVVIDLIDKDVRIIFAAVAIICFFLAIVIASSRHVRALIIEEG